MSAMIAFNHFNFNVLNLDRSLSFYREAFLYPLHTPNETSRFALEKQKTEKATIPAIPSLPDKSAK